MPHTYLVTLRIRAKELLVKNLSLCAIVFAVALSIVPNVKGQALGPSTIPTNIPQIRTFVAPPATFDPAVASAEELEQYGFPPKPDQVTKPDAYSAWIKAVSAPQTRLQSPQIEQTTIYNGPIRTQESIPTGESNPSSGPILSVKSSNWSGYVADDKIQNPFEKSVIFAYWIVPVAQHAFGNGNPPGWDYSSQWVGIDGFGSSDVLQAGTEADAYLSGATTATFYAAWIEWYPFAESRISNFSVAPGDEMFVEVWNSSPVVGNAYLLNMTAQEAVVLAFSAPSGTTLVGNSAEWIVERPGVNGGLAILTNYVACPFDSCVALGSLGGHTYNVAYFPGVHAHKTTIFSVSMTDNSGGVISIPSLVGPFDLWFRDTGSALRN